MSDELGIVTDIYHLLGSSGLSTPIFTSVGNDDVSEPQYGLYDKMSVIKTTFELSWTSDEIESDAQHVWTCMYTLMPGSVFPIFKASFAVVHEVRSSEAFFSFFSRPHSYFFQLFFFNSSCLSRRKKKTGFIFPITFLVSTSDFEVILGYNFFCVTTCASQLFFFFSDTNYVNVCFATLGFLFVVQLFCFFIFFFVLQLLSSLAGDLCPFRRDSAPI